MLDPRTRPRIVNVVSTAALGGPVDVKRMARLECCMYDEAIYGGRCGYVKTPGMKGRVTVFISGKMISVGADSVRGSCEQLHNAKFYLAGKGLAGGRAIKCTLRNIVATISTGQAIPIDRISPHIAGAVYDPESFPGMILKGQGSCSFLVFGSGKIVVAGAKSASDLNTSSFDLLARLNSVMDQAAHARKKPR